MFVVSVRSLCCMLSHACAAVWYDLFCLSSRSISVPYFHHAVGHMPFNMCFNNTSFVALPLSLSSVFFFFMYLSRRVARRREQRTTSTRAQRSPTARRVVCASQASRYVRPPYFPLYLACLMVCPCCNFISRALPYLFSSWTPCYLVQQ